MTKRANVSAAILALLAAALFGASAPFAKLLLGQIAPIPLAALLYLGSGLGTWLLRLGLEAFERVRRNPGGGEAPSGEQSGSQLAGSELPGNKLPGDQSPGSQSLSNSIPGGSLLKEPELGRADLPWLLGAILAGGVAAPILLMIGLERTPAATAALLLNFEAVSTSLIAFFAFHEAVGHKIWAAIGAVTLASALLSWNPGADWGISLGALAVLGACVLWGVDNNFTRSISSRDPRTIVILKGLGAGGFSALLAWGSGQAFPGPREAALALLLGAVSYGLSITLFILALRGLGAARTSALFGSAPFAGVILAVALLGERPGPVFFPALALMILGAVLLLSENHAHAHTHAVKSHDHRHNHADAHHAHAHPWDAEHPRDARHPMDAEHPRDARHLQDAEEEHAHPHTHEPIQHAHTHNPDEHHRHEHEHEE